MKELAAVYFKHPHFHPSWFHRIDLPTEIDDPQPEFDPRERADLPDNVVVLRSPR